MNKQALLLIIDTKINSILPFDKNVEERVRLNAVRLDVQMDSVMLPDDVLYVGGLIAEHVTRSCIKHSEPKEFKLL